MQKIIPHLWFDTQAQEAAEFYTRIFPNSAITNTTTLTNTPSGDSEIISFDLSGFSFMAINAGPYFTPNPSISFMVNFDPKFDPQAEQHLRELYAKLAEGGKDLMPLQAYPFSPLYVWVQDRFGISWQLILTDESGEDRPFIMPSLLFVGAVAGKAEAAMNFYTSIFAKSQVGMIARYPAGMEPDVEGSIMFADWKIADQWFTCCDSAHEHQFQFSEGISLLVQCESQEEIDTYWEKLSADPAAEQCGWLKDQFGVSWQITSSRLQEMLQTGTPEQIARVTQAFLQMKKFDVAQLEDAFQKTEN